MPIYRYECQACGRRHQEILALAEAAPESPCCQAPQRRLMPSRVRARVLEPGQAEAEKSRERTGELLARRADANRIRSEPSPLDIPAASWSGPATSKAEADRRAQDTTEAMAAWQTRSLAASGVEYTQAKRTAEQHQQAVTAEAVASNGTR